MVGLSSCRMMTEIVLPIEDNHGPQCVADSEDQ